MDNSINPRILAKAFSFLGAFLHISEISEADLMGGAWGACPLIFCNHFEELQTMLFEVELILNNAPLIYVYPNTINTCLTPNYLLFDRQLV